MEEPDAILQKILNFEHTYTPHFNNLIKQSLIANVDIEDDPDNDIYPQLPEPPPPAQQRKSASDGAIADINDHTHSIESLLSSSTKHRVKKKRRETPIIARAGTSPNPITMIDPSSFLNIDDIQYESEEDEDEEEHNINDYRFGEYDDEDESEEKPEDPLIEEYDELSHEIHITKVRLRKLDRQISMAQRMNESQSEFVVKHSTLKIKIAQLISKRRQLETHDIIKDHLKDEDVDTVDIDVGSPDIMDINDVHVIAIDEEEEEPDPEVEEEDEKEIINNDSNVDEDALSGFLSNLTGSNGYNDSRPTSSTMIDFDYSYDAIKEQNDDDEERIETGSVEIHSDSEDDGGGGSVHYHSSEEQSGSGDGGGSVEIHSSEENGGGSVEIHSSDDDNGGGSIEIHESEDTEENEYQDDDDDDGGGSVQMNDEIEQTENWVDEEFDTKSMEIHDSDKDNDEKDTKDNVNDEKDAKEDGNDGKEEEQINTDSRSKRLEQMKKRKSYREYGDEDIVERDHDLDELKDKYRDDRRNREQLSEIETPFSINDLLNKGYDDDKETEDALRTFRENMKIDEEDEIKDDGKDDGKDDDCVDDMPQLIQKRKSVLLDINQLSAKLWDIVEEEWSEDESEGRFQAIDYETDSDCDSNDSIVVKKEIIKNVTVSELQDNV